MKKFAALARVSSREQEREGFSLAVQEDALKRYAVQAGGEIVKLFRIAETASKTDERKTFKELIAYAKKHAVELDGLLFYKVDRAARNIFDYVELERIESEYEVPFISVSQPTDSNPAGRMMRRVLGSMASFYTEQQSLDIRDGQARRVQEGWFVGSAPYGYRNIRRDGRGIVEVDPVAAANLLRIFQLYAHENHTVRAITERMRTEGRIFRHSAPRFASPTVYEMLTDRAYIGEVFYRDQWYPGKHEPLIDRPTWDRVQSLLRGSAKHRHELTFAGEFMQCGHCGRHFTGERVAKRNKNRIDHYVYYRCTATSTPGHPRIRIREADIDRQVLALFDRIRIQDDSVRDWFRAVLSSQTKDAQQESLSQRAELQRQASLLVAQQDRLVNLRIDDQIDQDTFARKQTELRDRLASIKLQLDVIDRSHDETAELAVEVFELSQALRDKWLSADYASKRRILEIVWLNCKVEGVTLVPTIRKPFDVLAEGLVSKETGADQDRTGNLLHAMQALSQLSYGPATHNVIGQGRT